MTRRTIFGLAGLPLAAAENVQCDVLVYGGTLGGIAAAATAARGGARVLLLEPTRHIGGMATSGLSHQDFRTYEGLTGFCLAFNRRVEAVYRARYGSNSAQVRACRRGTHGEPHVNEAVLTEMLGAVPVRYGQELRAVKREGRSVRSAEFSGGLTVEARVFIDATYEGDLMAAAGVNWRAGCEGRAEYGEPTAPAEASGQLQAYNFRLTATKNPALRVAVAKPPGYDRASFQDLVPLLESGRIKSVFAHVDCVFRAQPLEGLPNGKYDLNDVSLGIVRQSLPGENLAWPDGDAAARKRVYDRHLRYQTGLLWFLQNEEAVPARFREEARQWGWCKDEYADNGHLPWQLYVREARRMVGRRVFTEHDVDPAPGDARAVFHADSIAMGDYGPNCHGTSHEGPLYGGRHRGEFYKHTPPYQIPYATLLPREYDNLLVPVACSASHVGFAALRYEPIWASLGEAAGIAASMALRRRRVDLSSVPASAIQQALHRRGAATIYVSDVLPGSPLFEAVQWLGARGGLHGLAPAREKAYGELIEGQYFQAFPGHFFEPDKPITRELRERWLALAPEGVRKKVTAGGLTRGQVAREIFDLVSR